MKALFLAYFFTVICFGANTNIQSTFRVNNLNGGGSIRYSDFVVVSTVIPFQLQRTYNSITAITEGTGWQGAFGWGWTSPFETTLTTTPEKHVILRDGETGNTVTFRPSKEDPKAKEIFFEAVKKAYFEAMKERTHTAQELKKLSLPEKIFNRLKTDPGYRIEMASKYGIKTPVPQGESLTSSEYGYQTIQFKNNQWIREKDGIKQYFDNVGRLVKQADKNGFYFEYKYSVNQKMQIEEIVDQNRTMSLKFTWRQDKIAEITDNKGRKARYVYDKNSNLVNSTDSLNQTYLYYYENKKFPHLMTKIQYPKTKDSTDNIREIQYDDNGLIVFHKDRDGSETQYIYGKNPSDPENNFFTKTIRKSGGNSEEFYDEFFIRARSDGSKYLFKQESKMGGINTTTIYSTCCGQPLQITKNGETTQFKYYDNGLLMERSTPKETVKFEYEPKWNRVSKVIQPSLVSNYEYDGKGNLIRASNSKKLQVLLSYDKMGRIQEMSSGKNRTLSFEYGDKGKPSTITDRGQGSIKLQYDSEGKIIKTETVVTTGGVQRKPNELKSQEIIKKVMNGFQDFLEILRPAGVGLTSIGGL